MASFVENTQHKVERKAFEIMTNSIVGKLTKTDDIAKRQETFLELIDKAETFWGNGADKATLDKVREYVKNPENRWVKFVNRVLDETNPNYAKKFLLNLGYEAFFRGTKTIRANREKYNCNIPWLILFDPTDACNMHCVGCWSGTYGHKNNMSYEDLDKIVTQGKELGTYLYFMTGGEPTVRKNDILKLAEKHNDCMFGLFSNSTLIDEEFCQEMLRVKNFVPAISLEGFETANDGRRGPGVFDKVKHAMQLLKEHNLPFGISTCYTSMNYKDITSEEFYDMIIEAGALFIWFFHYMPVGNDAAPELMPNPEQRKAVYERIRAFRSSKPIFSLDFQNDAEYIGGCIAGGRYYLHINAAGDVDPCVFIHYSNANIHEVSLLDALKSPIFQAYRKGQPFNDNMLRPCPMLENPECLPKMVKETGAHSTDPQSPEDVQHLCDKCKPYAEAWTKMADKLWVERQTAKK